MRSSFTLIFLCLIALIQGCAAAIATGAVAGTAAGVSLVYDRRGLGTVIDDQSIELQASAALRNDKKLHGRSHINVTSYNGIVLLTGETASEALKARAARIVQAAVPSIRRLYNEIAISAPSSLASRAHDLWITTKIKAKMIAAKGISPTRVEIVTERGIVYLLGLVTSQEARRAVAVARRTEGVQRVVKAFEYLSRAASE